jgi:ribosomal protein S19
MRTSIRHIFLAPHHIAAEAVVYNGSIILGVRLN